MDLLIILMYKDMILFYPLSLIIFISSILYLSIQHIQYLVYRKFHCPLMAGEIDGIFNRSLLHVTMSYRVGMWLGRCTLIMGTPLICSKLGQDWKTWNKAHFLSLSTSLTSKIYGKRWTCYSKILRFSLLSVSNSRVFEKERVFDFLSGLNDKLIMFEERLLPETLSHP